MSTIKNAEQFVQAIEGARNNALTILSELDQTYEVRTLKSKIETSDDPHVIFLTVQEVLKLVVSRHSQIAKPNRSKQQYI